MIHKVFSFYDSKAEAYLPPFFMKAKGEALRFFSDLANDKTNANNPIGKHPEDYTLFELGTFYDDNAQFQMGETPKSLGVAIEFVKS